MDNGNFVGRNDDLAECVFAIALTQGTSCQYGHASKEAKRVLTKDRGKFLALAPNLILVVSKNNVARFGMKWMELLVLLDC